MLVVTDVIVTFFLLQPLDDSGRCYSQVVELWLVFLATVADGITTLFAVEIETTLMMFF